VSLSYAKKMPLNSCILSVISHLQLRRCTKGRRVKCRFLVIHLLYAVAISNSTTAGTTTRLRSIDGMPSGLHHLFQVFCRKVTPRLPHIAQAWRMPSVIMVVASQVPRSFRHVPTALLLVGVLGAPSQAKVWPDYSHDCL
jgi:hypothetical protein